MNSVLFPYILQTQEKNNILLKASSHRKVCKTGAEKAEMIDNWKKLS